MEKGTDFFTNVVAAAAGRHHFARHFVQSNFSQNKVLLKQTIFNDARSFFRA